MLNVREKLIDLVKRAIIELDYGDAATQIADHLIANGVTVRAKGEWKHAYVERGYFTAGGNRPWVCSKCGQIESWNLGKPQSNFCCNCGADMRGEEHG